MLATMIVDLLYGKTGLSVTFDDDLDVTVVAKPRMPLVPDADVAVRQALAVPVGCPPLAELARGKNSACILICDVTRPVPKGLFLRPLFEALL
ncbi:MAG: lactate racemase domain-containing protein, partial [Gammaproteobacteria bacterium]|nr:lactate racemase domain-containing protein [Gammaproteobacteria bacterium]